MTNNLSTSRNFFWGGSTSGPFVNENTALQTAAVFACIRVISEAVASLPIHVYRYTDGGQEMLYKHPLHRLLHDAPNPEMTSFDLRETLMSHLLLYGNAYAQIVRNNAGRVMALYPLMPNKMEVSRNESGEIYYTYWRNSDEARKGDPSGNVTLSRDYVLHIHGLGFDGLTGYSPIAMAKNAISMAIATEEYGAGFFANSANPGGLLTHPDTLNDQEKIRQTWEALYKRSSKSHGICVLEEGMEFHPVSVPPEQAQFLETRKFQLGEIARIFRVPPHMIGDLEKSSFSNIEQMSMEFAKYTLNPWVVRWEQAMKQALLLPSEQEDYFIRFNMDGLLRADYVTRMRGYAIARQNGLFSTNDVRRLENMNILSPEEGGDLYLVNGNMVKLIDAGAAYYRKRSEV